MIIIIASIFLSAVLGDPIPEIINVGPVKYHRYSDGNYVNPDPWVAFITDGDNHKCSGSILTYSIVLTSAECVINPKNGLNAWVGGNIGQEGSSRHEVIDVRIHSRFQNINDTISNNVALIKVSPPFTFNKNVDEVSLPKKAGGFVAANTIASISGWSTIQNKNASDHYERHLSHANMQIVDGVDCAKKIIEADRATNGRFCATVHGRGICQGDSGGPVVKNGVQIGIIPSTLGCDKDHHVRAFLNVELYLSWILVTATAMEPRVTWAQSNTQTWAYSGHL